MVTTQVVQDCEATCGPSVCGIYFNTNHTNLTNCAGVNLQLGKNSIRVRLERFVLKETRIELPPTWRFYPARLVRLERFVFKETTHTAVPHVDLLSGATWVVTLNVKSNNFRTKTFNIFYVFGREKFSTSSIRAPIKPRKFPQKHLENPQKHLEFSTSDVFLPL